MKKQKKYILIGYRNKKIGIYKPRRNKFKVAVGFILFGFGALTFPLPTGSPLFMGFGLMLLRPISLKNQLRNTKEDLKFKINKYLILWGLK